MTLFNKIKWILGISLIFFLVITTNLIDRQNFSIISDSIETIYADRLVAQDVIYDLSSAMQEKKSRYLEQDGASANVQGAINNRIDLSLERFAATKLTPAEAQIFSQFKTELNRLKKYEQEQAAGEELPAEGLQNSLGRLKEHLDDLSEVQMSEGRRELYESKKAIQSANLFTQLEIAAMVIMALLIQIIILYTPKPDLDA